MKKKNFILYIDDTGFNPKEKVSVVLQNEKATHVGIIVREELVPELEYIMDGLCSELKKKYNSDEFHFTYIYNHSRAFENIQIEETLDILDTFADIFDKYSLRIVANTINSLYSFKSANYVDEINGAIKSIGLPVNEKSQSFFFTYTKAKQHTEQLTKRAHISNIVCDEGLKKRGTKLTIPHTGTKIIFEDSAKEKLLQLADYAAWFFTRSKNIIDKVQKTGKLSNIDRAVMLIYEKLSPHYVGTKASFTLDENLNYDELFNNSVSNQK